MSRDCHVYKALYGYIDIDISNFVSFVNNGRTKSSQLRTLKTPFCRTSTFQSSYFNCIVKLWNRTIHVILKKTSSLLLFKRAINDMYKSVLNRSFDLSMPCTWTFVHDCSFIAHLVIVIVVSQTEAINDTSFVMILFSYLLKQYHFYYSTIHHSLLFGCSALVVFFCLLFIVCCLFIVI